jgi:dihydroneopterin aldolase
MQNNSSSIIVSRLELSAHIGVPDSERLEAQRLTLNLELVPAREMTALGDALENTVDYFALTRRVRLLAAARPRKLIETLAEEICSCVLSEFPVRAVGLELRKYILPDTEYVAIRMQCVRD